jgi:hypothetical protein
VIAMNRALLLATLFPFCAAFEAEAATCSASSGAKLVPVVELFTSEGCDSCPPADKWFSAIQPASGVLPLAFHVDYWDYIGWKDPYGKAAFGARQRDGVRRQGGRVAYTPQVVLDGKDLRSWFRSAALESGLAELHKRVPRARVTLNVALNGGLLEFVAQGDLAESTDRASAALFVAVTESNLTSKVSAGENRGVTLKHDHVVRELIGPMESDAEGRFVVRRSLALDAGWKTKDLAVAAFVQDRKTGATLQSVRLGRCELLGR